MSAKWLSFQIEDRRRGAKTDVWHVWSLRDRPAHIGVVKWFAPLRSYAIFPDAEIILGFEHTREISEFLLSETAKQRKGKRAFSE